MIELENLGYSYAGEGLLNGVNLRLAPGSFHFLTGPSGVGKSTLIKLCYAELFATSGFARLFGTDTRKLSRDEIAQYRQKIGIVHQDCRFLDHLSMAENIALPVTVAAREAADTRKNLTDLMDWVGLSEHKAALPPSLSGGERQRAALARALINSPELILADEPTGNVDWDMSQRLMRLLIELNRMGKTILIATHDMGLIRATKSHVQARVLRIRDRKIEMAGADL